MSTHKDTKQGMFKYPKGAARLCDFGGMRYGGGRWPTDVDAYMELDNKFFIFIEMKSAGAEVRNGQGMALERLVRAVQAGGKSAILLVGEHEKYGGYGPINVANASVRCYYNGVQWRKPEGDISVRQAVDAWLYSKGWSG